MMSSGAVRIYDTSGLPGPLDTPVLVEPMNGAGQAEVPLLVWNRVPNARSYRLEYTTASNFYISGPRVRISGIVDTSYTPVGLPAGVTYRWRVWAEAEGTGSAWSDTRTFTSGASAPSVAPVLIEPADGATLPAGAATLRWGAVAQATRYRLHIATDLAFTTIVHGEVVTGGVVSVPGLAPDVRHYWRVRGENDLGAGPWANARWFRLAFPAPAAPDLLTPANGELGVSVSTPFTWEAAPPASDYTLQFAHSPTFDLVVRSHTTTETTYVPAPPLDANRLYFWRVRGSTVDGPGAWSSGYSFTTQAIVAGDDGAPSEVVIGAPSPNPSTGEVGMRIALPQAARVAVLVYDALGREVAGVSDDARAAGWHDLRWSAAGLPAGVYVVRTTVQTSDGETRVVTHRLSVVR